MDVQEEAAERYDRLPWDHLVPPPDPDRRRWLMGGVVVVVLGAFLGFRAGSGTAAVPPPAEAAVTVGEAVGVTEATPEDPVPDTIPLAPTTPTAVPPPVVASPIDEADRVSGGGPSPALASGVQRLVATTFAGPGVFVDGVLVHADDAGAHVAVVSLYEVVDGTYVRVPDVAVAVQARQEGATVVVDEMVPIPVPEVRMTEPMGEVESIPDPVIDAVREALAIWPDAEVLRAGNDAHGWWAEVALRLPGGAGVPLVIRPPLPVGTGSGG